MSMEQVDKGIADANDGNGYMNYDLLATVALKLFAENATDEQLETVTEGIKDYAQNYADKQDTIYAERQRKSA